MASNNAIPELVKIGSIPTNMTQEIETAIQEPVVADESTIRFSIHKRGFIHSNSKLVLSLNKKVDEAGEWFLPLNIGIGSLIKSVAFRIGDVTIQEVSDWAELHAYRSLFIAGESNKEKEQYTSQRCSNYDVQYDRYEPVNAITLPEGMSEELDNGRAPDYAFIGASNPAIDNTANVNKLVLPFQHLDQEPTYQISLQDLVPFFKQNQLPAWVINPDIYLDITLQDGVNRCCCGTGATATYVHTINKSETKLIIDHIFYPGDVMEAWKNANKKLQFTFFDYRLSKMSLTEAQAETQIVRNIGGAGRIVTKVICGLANEVNDTLANGGANSKSLLNKFNSQCSQRLYAASNGTEAQGKTTSNLKFNDHFLYPVDRDNTAVHFYDVTQSEGIVPFVTRDLYSGETNTTGLSTFQTHPYLNGLQGKFFWQSWRLNRSERISSRGIELYQKYNNVPALPTPATDTYTLRCWLEILKYATLEDGKMTCYFA